MLPWILFGTVITGMVLALWIPRYRLRLAIERPFPEAWIEYLEQNIEVYPRLPMPLRLQLRKLIKQFLHQKHFAGAGGLEMTDEIRVTIAAQACMLILNRSSGVYPGLRYIIVYPTTFVAGHGHADEAGIAGHGPRVLLGESWQAGKVILAWDSVRHGAANFLDAQNVVLHEFTHQLDSETGSANGAPLLGGASSYNIWAKVLSAEFEKLQAARRKGRRSLMDHYGATNPAEFFAVATETFFEKPRRMARDHAELFETLKAYYRVDPRDWLRK